MSGTRLILLAGLSLHPPCVVNFLAVDLNRRPTIFHSLTMQQVDIMFPCQLIRTSHRGCWFKLLMSQTLFYTNKLKGQLMLFYLLFTIWVSTVKRGMLFYSITFVLLWNSVCDQYGMFCKTQFHRLEKLSTKAV